MTRRFEPAVCETGKRCYVSERDAHDALRSAGFRYRIYRCECCGKWHVTNTDKNAKRGLPSRRYDPRYEEN